MRIDQVARVISIGDHAPKVADGNTNPGKPANRSSMTVLSVESNAAKSADEVGRKFVAKV